MSALSPLRGAGAQESVGRGEASVEGTHLLRDGRRWIPHGFHQIAFVVAPQMFEQAPPFFRVAAKNYTPGEYAEMRAHGADSVRIQVAQNGIDPQGAAFTREFRDAVVGAVRAAREAGLTVILSIQNEEQTGQQQLPVELPTAATERVWHELAPVFGQDRGVMYELFNEPRMQPMPPGGPSPAQWKAWAGAMNRMIAVVRERRAVNVLVADGLQRGETLDGAPRLSDSLQQVVYASHPYAHSSAEQERQSWDRKFGNFARTAPVLISEWGIGYYCDVRTPKATEAFLNYLEERGIGLEIVAWDWAPPKFGSFNYGFPHPQVSAFQGVCEGRDLPAGFGPGKMVERWFRTGSPAVVADGTKTAAWR